MTIVHGRPTKVGATSCLVCNERSASHCDAGYKWCVLWCVKVLHSRIAAASHSVLWFDLGFVRDSLVTLDHLFVRFSGVAAGNAIAA